MPVRMPALADLFSPSPSPPLPPSPSPVAMHISSSSRILDHACSYLHVFKSGGTSVIALLKWICVDFKLVCSSRMPWCQPFAPGMYDRMGVAK